MERAMTVREDVAGTVNRREVVETMNSGRKRGHVAIWLDILRDAYSQWEKVENGAFRRSTR